MERYKICSIIVTYNRKELLAQNIESLLAQTYPTDILVVDNASTDGTREYVEAKMKASKNVQYCNTGKNAGGAGGFSYGLETAYGMDGKYDLFWLMDDDGHPANKECLENIVSVYDNDRPYDILNSIIECDVSSGKLSFELSDFLYVQEAQQAASENQLTGHINPFNGTLLSRTLVQKIGYPNADFFVGYDEVEYITRGQVKANSKLITVTNSLYYHPSRLPEEFVPFLGKKIVYKSHPTWKDYYRMRNTVYTLKKYQSASIAKKYAWKNIVNCIIFPSKDKWNRIKVIVEGYKDGMRNDFTKNTKHIKNMQQGK